MSIMCGIFGVIAKNDKKYNEFMVNVEQKKKRLIDNLTPRGPDSFGEFKDDKCFLLGTCLKICDLSDDANQPYSSNGITIVFNGEIYNHQELRKTLEDKGYHFDTQSDTEVIVRMYEDEGLSFVDKLIGMFAFCLYDTKHKEVLLFRDRIGIKPLFYCETNDVVIFSSDIKSILCCINDEQHHISPKSISSYLSFRNVIGCDTMYENVKKIAPGHYMMIHRNACSICKYWSIDQFNIDTIPDLYDSIDKLKKLIQMAVMRNSVNNDDDIHIFLSGGLDSSAIVYFVEQLVSARICPKNIKTYSIGFDTENEFDYASLVATKFQTEHTNMIVNTDEYMESLVDLVAFKGEPLNVPNEPLIYIMSKKAKMSGNVVLSGEGADELLYGYGRLFDSYYNYLKDESMPFYEYFMQRYAYLPEDFKKSLINSDMWENELERDKDLKKIFEKTFDECGDMHNQDRIGYVMLKLHLPCLLARLDNATMCASVEGRVPYLDNDVVENCVYNIQREHKIKLIHETSLSQLMNKNPEDISEKLDSPKYILKEMLSKYLPQDVLTRKKVGFTVPIERILLEKFDVIVKTLETGYINKLHIFELTELTKRFKNQTCDKNDIFAIWMLVNMEVFAQLFIYNISLYDVKSFFLVDPQYKYEKSKLVERITISDEQQLQRYIKLYIIKSLLEKHGIEYFAYGGTMLGCIRHRGFIPWDDDIDLMIIDEQCPKITDEFRMELLYAGFNIKKSPEGYKIFDYLENNFFVDLFIAQYIDNDKKTINYASGQFLESFPGRYITTDELYPLANYDFGFFTISGIKNPKNYFDRCNFGDYMRSAIVSQLHDSTNNDMLQGFLTKYGLKNLMIRDITFINRTPNVVFTDDWKQYFNRAKDMIPQDFNPNNYLILNKDLVPSAYTDTLDLYVHYIKYGKTENRKYNIDSVLPLDFDTYGYKCMNPDLVGMSEQQLCAHYITIGKDAGRNYNIRSLLPYDFNADMYKFLNPDLDDKTDEQLINHYIHHGKIEKRYYTKEIVIPNNFNYKKYLELNADLKIHTERDAIIHYIRSGRKENRHYK